MTDVSRTSVSVDAPPSKSLSHRKLIAASLAEGATRLSHVLESEDINRTIAVLQGVGVRIEREAPGAYAVTGLGGAPSGGERAPVSCFMGESGTSCRLLTAILAAGEGSFAVHGVPRLHERPMAELLETLARLGAGILCQGKPGYLPIQLGAHGLSQPGDAWLPVRADLSSQFLSGLLLAAPLARDGLRICLEGERVASWPYVVLTLQTLEESGISISVTTLQEGEWREIDWRMVHAPLPGATRFEVHRGQYRPLAGDSALVEGDYSGASCLLAAGAIGPTAVTVRNLRRDSSQGDRVFLDFLEGMGASVSWQGGDVTVRPGALRGIRRNMLHCPDLVPAVAVLASFADSPTVLEGVGNLRLKESDRLAAPVMELAKVGVQITVTDDAMTILPTMVRSGETIHFSAHNDHRMAMSLALLELAGIGVILDDPSCVGKSFPSFWEIWRTIFPDTRVAVG